MHQSRLFAPTCRELGLSFLGDGQGVWDFHALTNSPLYISGCQTVSGKNKRLPSGHYVEYGGQVENQQQAMRQLAVMGWLITSTLLTLIVLPTLYALFATRLDPDAKHAET